jgi:hypothetical protein
MAEGHTVINNICEVRLWRTTPVTTTTTTCILIDLVSYRPHLVRARRRNNWPIRTRRCGPSSSTSTRR